MRMRGQNSTSNTHPVIMTRITHRRKKKSLKKVKNVFLGTKQIALIKLNEANILPEKLYMAIKQELGRTNA